MTDTPPTPQDQPNWKVVTVWTLGERFTLGVVFRDDPGRLHVFAEDLFAEQAQTQLEDFARNRLSVEHLNYIRVVPYIPQFQASPLIELYRHR